MSRSNPTTDNPNPCTRWFEWDGANGTVRYYDKEQKKNIDVGDDITFLLLDQLATVKGWNDETESGIFANEVRDTRAQTLVVKAFKAKRPIAEGFYKEIKDKVAAAGGHFVANLYVAYREGKELKLGSIQFKGAALGVWMEFHKENRKDIDEQAVRIKGSTEGKKGKVVFKTPKFEIKNVSSDTNEEAKSIDKELQEYLAGYFKRTRREQASPRPTSEEDFSQENPEDTTDHSQEHDSEDIPF